MWVESWKWYIACDSLFLTEGGGKQEVLCSNNNIQRAMLCYVPVFAMSYLCMTYKKWIFISEVEVEWYVFTSWTSKPPMIKHWKSLSIDIVWHQSYFRRFLPYFLLETFPVAHAIVYPTPVIHAREQPFALLRWGDVKIMFLCWDAENGSFLWIPEFKKCSYRALKILPSGYHSNCFVSVCQLQKWRNSSCVLHMSVVSPGICQCDHLVFAHLHPPTSHSPPLQKAAQAAQASTKRSTCLRNGNTTANKARRLWR